MKSQNVKAAQRLPQSNATWHCGIREMPAWVDETGTPFRPYIGLVVTQEQELVLGQEMWSEQVTAEEVFALLLQTMTAPMVPEVNPSRPRRIHFNDDSITNQLRGRLLALGIQVRSYPTLPLIDSIIAHMGEYLEAEGIGAGFPSLVKIPGVEEKWLREYFTVAADFARVKPWKWLEDIQPLAVRFPAGGPERYIAIMGHGGETFGMAVYEKMESLALVYNGAPPEVAVQYGNLLSVLLDDNEFMSFADLDAITYHNWPVAGPNFYPAVMKYVDIDDIDRPTLDELIFLSACLRAVPTFIKKHLVTNKGLRDAAQHTFKLPNLYQKQTIELRYPVDLDAVDESIIESATFKVIDDLSMALEIGDITWDDLDLRPEDMTRLRLISFIMDWDFREDQMTTAMAIGSFMFAFADNMIEAEFLAKTTVEDHMDNAWHIGRFLLEEGDIDQFLPKAIFSQKPKFVQEFKHQVSAAKTRVASYKRTWRKLGRFADLLDENEWPPK